MIEGRQRATGDRTSSAPVVVGRSTEKACHTACVQGDMSVLTSRAFRGAGRVQTPALRRWCAEPTRPRGPILSAHLIMHQRIRHRSGFTCSLEAV